MLNLDIGWLFINFQKLMMYALSDFLVQVQTIQPQMLEPNQVQPSFSYLLCEKTTNSAPKATHNHVLFAVTHIYSVCMQWPFQCYFHTGDIGVNVLWIYHHCSLENIWTNSPYCPVLRDCLLLCLAEPWSLCEQVRVKFPDAAISPTSASSFLYVQRSTGLFLAFKGCACSFS